MADVATLRGVARVQRVSRRFEVVINDVYSGARMPGELATTEFASQVARVLRRGGWYVANVADGRPLAFVRSQVATLRTVFRQVCLIAEPGTLRGRRFGNLVLVAATDGGRLPIAELTHQVTRGALPARLLHGGDLDRFVADAAPVTDQAAADSPEPPAGFLGTR
jgi:spermidine synthase